MIKKTLFVWILLSSTMLCAETPAEGAAVIHELVKEKNYDVLFPTRYSEWYKVKKEGVAEDVAIAKLSKLFEKEHEVILSAYAQLTKADFTLSEQENPQISETGKVASAIVKISSKEIPFKLYEIKGGAWGFRL